MVSPASRAAPAFVEVPLRPRFFQSSAYFPMPIVLLGTMTADGAPNLAPYSLCFPHVTSEGHRLTLVTRSASKTAENLLRSGRVSMSFLPDSPEHFAALKTLAAPIPTAEKMARVRFQLHDSTLGPGADGVKAPPHVAEAVQVFECHLIASEKTPDSDEHRFELEVEKVLMPKVWADTLESGGRGPKLMVDYGFRRGTDTWLSRPRVVTSGPRLRPAFQADLGRAPERVLAEFKAALAHPDAPVVGKIRDLSLQIGMPPAEVKTFSPSMDLRLETTENGGTRVYGRIGPQPQVWTTFMFFHMMLAMFGLGGLMWGLARLTANESGWPIWILPIALVLHVFVAGAAFIGQGLSADQIHRMRSFVDDVIDQ